MHPNISMAAAGPAGPIATALQKPLKVSQSDWLYW